MFRIATWNLDRPVKRRIRRSDERLGELARHDVDVWILTETDRDLALPGYDSVATHRPADPGYEDREAYAAIHSRRGLRPVDFKVFDPCFAVCAEVDSPYGPLLVYGSIITYHHDGVVEGAAKPWERHRESVRQQAEDWRRLRDQFAGHALVVGGDFNQALDGNGRYRDAESTRRLRSAFADTGLQCLTDEDFSGELESRHSVDHIAMSDSPVSAVAHGVHVWKGVTPAGVRLSDHNGVAIDLGLR